MVGLCVCLALSMCMYVTDIISNSVSSFLSLDYTLSLSDLASSLVAVSRPSGRWPKERLGPRLPGLGGDPYSPLGVSRRGAVCPRNVLNTNVNTYELALPCEEGKYLSACERPAKSGSPLSWQMCLLASGLDPSAPQLIFIELVEVLASQNESSRGKQDRNSFVHYGFDRSRKTWSVLFHLA